MQYQPTYTLHLPPSWWQKHPAAGNDERLALLKREFPACEAQFQARSVVPVLSNDCLYRHLHYREETHLLLGDVLGLSLLPELFGQNIAAGDRDSDAACMSHADIRLIDVTNLFRRRLATLEVVAKEARNAGKQPWGWINVPDCLQTAWFLRGSRILAELARKDANTVAVLRKATEVIKEAFHFSYRVFAPLVDARLIHTAHCYLAMASPSVLEILLPFEREIADFIRNDLGLPYRLHLCTRPAGSLLEFLGGLGPVDEAEVTAASRVNWNHLPVRPRKTVELLENDFFLQPLDRIEHRARSLAAMQIEAVLYEMDEPVDPRAIGSFVRSLTALGNGPIDRAVRS